MDDRTTPPPHDETPDGSMIGPVEGRVLGCLLEKERTTPADYPLTLASLVRACNQSTSREPVVALGEDDVRRAAEDLKSRGLLRVVHSISNRALRYRQVATERWVLDDAEAAVLTVLLLRGPQTFGELRSRTERLAELPDVEAVAGVVARLVMAERSLAVEVERRPGQKERRFAQVVAAPFEGAAPVAHPAGPDQSRPDQSRPDQFRPGAPAPGGAGPADLAARVGHLEGVVADLVRRLDELGG